MRSIGGLTRDKDNGFPVNQGFYCNPLGSNGFRLMNMNTDPVVSTFSFDCDDFSLGIDIQKRTVIHVHIDECFGNTKHSLFFFRCMFDPKTYYIMEDTKFQSRKTKKVIFLDLVDEELVFSEVKSFHYTNRNQEMVMFLDRDTSYWIEYGRITVIRWDEKGQMHGVENIVTNFYCHTLVSNVLFYYINGSIAFSRFDNEAIDRKELENVAFDFDVRPDMRMRIVQKFDFTDLFPMLKELRISIERFHIWYLSAERKEAMCVIVSNEIAHFCVFKNDEVSAFPFIFPRRTSAALPPFSTEMDHRRFLTRMYSVVDCEFSKFERFYSLKDVILECNDLKSSQLGTFMNSIFFKTNFFQFVYNFVDNIIFYQKYKIDTNHAFYYRYIAKMHDYVKNTLRSVDNFGVEMQIIDVDSFKLGEYPVYNILTGASNVLLFKEEHVYWWSSYWNDEVEYLKILRTSIHTEQTELIITVEEEIPEIIYCDLQKIVLQFRNCARCFELNGGVWELTRELNERKAYINPYATELSVQRTKKKHFFLCDADEELKVQHRSGLFIKFLSPRIVLLDSGIFRITKRCRLTNLIDFSENNFTVADANCFQTQNTLTIFVILDSMIVHRRYMFNDTHIISSEVLDSSLQEWLTHAEFVEVDVFRDLGDHESSGNVVGQIDIRGVN
ncbi:hypothetical protein PCE1_001640 [Barthelona sp. PCE]